MAHPHPKVWGVSPPPPLGGTSLRGHNLYPIPVQTLRANFLNTFYFRRGPVCTIGLANDLIDGKQTRAQNGF